LVGELALHAATKIKARLAAHLRNIEVPKLKTAAEDRFFMFNQSRRCQRGKSIFGSTAA